MRLVVLCLVALIASPAGAQAPYHHPDDTGFALAPGYTRATNGADINTFSIEAVATVGPSVDLFVGVASAGVDGRRTVPTLVVGGTAYVVAGPGLWLGPTASVSVAEVFTGRPVGVFGTGGLAVARRWEAGPVGVVARGELTASTPFTDRTHDAPFASVALGGGLQFSPNGEVVLAVEPAVGHAFAGTTPTGNGLTVVGGTLRVVRARGGRRPRGRRR